MVTHGYGTPPDKNSAIVLLNRALDRGYNYPLRYSCSLRLRGEGVREIDGRPDVIRKTCEDSLRRLRTEVIGFYYLHRMDI